ncbi:MAG: alpha/beta fold hydrolase [Oryzihumus sp.]
MPNSDTLFLDRGTGRVAYDLAGAPAAPLVVCLSGMGDIRSTYRHLSPALLDAGLRVARLELRGHGDSDTGFEEYDDAAAASDLVALIEHLGGPALVVGHSMGASSALVAAAQRPDLVTGLVLVGPFARQPEVNPVLVGVMRVAMLPLWARAAWKSYLPKLYAGRLPEDHEAHVAAMMASLAPREKVRAFSRTTRTSHLPAERALDAVRAPALVVMGALDPDFTDPAAEAAWIRDRIGAEVLMVPEAAHYPHAQRPDLVSPAVVAFAEKVLARG